MEHVLDGITVIDAATFLAGPSAATIMADFGADVIKIEPPAGDGYRLLKGPYPVPYHWQLTSRNKRSLALDLATADGRAVLHELIGQADVLTTNFLDDGLAKYELEYERLRSINPRLIYARVTGFGDDGPDAGRRAFDVTAWWARSGMMELVRDPGQTPLAAAPGMGDHATGTALFGAIMTGLYRRERTGEGALVSTSLLANGAWANGMSLQGAIAGFDLAEVRQHADLKNPYTSSYECADGAFVVLAGLNMAREWPAICRAIGREEWLDDPERSHFKYPLRNRSVAGDEIGAAVRRFTRSELTARLDAEGVTYGTVPSLTEVIADEQMLASGVIVPTGDDGDDYRFTVNSPIEIGDEPKRSPQRAPDVGAHSVEVLRQFGFDADRVERLVASGVVQTGG